MTQPPTSVGGNWRKPTRSNHLANCVEVQLTGPDGRVGVRDTKNRDVGSLAIPVAVWGAFVAAIHAGELDC